MAIGEGVAVWQRVARPGVKAIGEDVFHFSEFVGPFIIAPDDFRKESDVVVDFNRSSEGVVEAEFFSNWPDPDIWAGGAEDGGAAALFLLIKDVEHFAVKGAGEDFVDEFLSQRVEFIAGEPPEVVEEGTLHVFGANELGKWQEGEEGKQVKSAQRHAFEHEVAKQ